MPFQANFFAHYKFGMNYEYMTPCIYPMIAGVRNRNVWITLGKPWRGNLYTLHSNKQWTNSGRKKQGGKGQKEMEKEKRKPEWRGRVFVATHGITKCVLTISSPTREGATRHNYCSLTSTLPRVHAIIMCTAQPAMVPELGVQSEGYLILN